MDPASVELLINGLARGLGLLSDWTRLAQRVQMGERISLDEIRHANGGIAPAVGRWNDAAENDRSD